MSQFWTFFDQNGSIFLSVVVPPPPTHNTLNYNRLSIILISLLFWVRVNPNPDTMAELTLTCRGGADPTRQAAATVLVLQYPQDFPARPAPPSALSPRPAIRSPPPPSWPPGRPLACPSVRLSAYSPASPISFLCRPVSSIRRP